MGAVVARVLRPCAARSAGPVTADWTALAARLAGALGLIVAAGVVSLAWAHPATRPLARFCCRYSPGRLAHGEIWTLPGSALLVPRLRMIGPTTIMTTALFLPYVLVAGTRRAFTVFFTGHVLATAAVAAVVLPGAVWGWAPAVVLRNLPDVGASAGLAATAGALAGHLGRRRGGVLLGGALVAWFAGALVVNGHLVEVEHLLALGTGAAVERPHVRGRAVRGPRRSGESPWRHPQNRLWQVSMRWRRTGNTLGVVGRAKGHDDGP